MDAKTKVNRYRKQSIHYFDNALHYIEAGDVEKASEFIWGSLAQALKAVAASKDIKLMKHNDIRNYALNLTRELKDEEIMHAFIIAQALHSNFYECGLQMDDVVLGAEEVKKVIAKLFSLILTNSKS